MKFGEIKKIPLDIVWAFVKNYSKIYSTLTLQKIFHATGLWYNGGQMVYLYYMIYAIPRWFWILPSILLFLITTNFTWIVFGLLQLVLLSSFMLTMKLIGGGNAIYSILMDKADYYYIIPHGDFYDLFTKVYYSKNQPVKIKSNLKKCLKIRYMGHDLTQKFTRLKVDSTHIDTILKVYIGEHKMKDKHVEVKKLSLKNLKHWDILKPNYVNIDEWIHEI